MLLQKNTIKRKKWKGQGKDLCVRSISELHANSYVYKQELGLQKLEVGW